MTASPPEPWVEAWLSTPRFGVYLTAAAGDRQLALDLYEWNATVSAAFQHDMAHLEVALRNAYDAALTAGTPAGHPHWTLDATRLFPVVWRTAQDGTRIDSNRTPRDQVDRAVREAGPGAPAGKVIAELSFGFWRYLSTSAHHHPLWIPYLHKAFTPGISRQTVDRPVGRLHKLRNRVAHLEPLLRQNLAGRHDDVLIVAGLISAELRDYIAGTSEAPAIIGRRPVP